MEGHIWTICLKPMFKKKRQCILLYNIDSQSVFPLVLWVHKKGQLSTTSLSLLANLCKVLGHVALGDVICFLKGLRKRNGQVIFPVSLRNNLQVEFNSSVSIHHLRFGRFINFPEPLKNTGKNAGHFMRHQHTKVWEKTLHCGNLYKEA